MCSVTIFKETVLNFPHRRRWASGLQKAANVSSLEGLQIIETKKVKVARIFGDERGGAERGDFFRAKIPVPYRLYFYTRFTSPQLRHK